MKKNLTLKSLDINPNIYFFGTDKAIEQAERKEEEQAAAVSAIISAPAGAKCTMKLRSCWTTWGSR